MLGPGPPKGKSNRERDKERDNRTESRRGLTFGGQGSSIENSSGDTTIAVEPPDDTILEHERISGDDWNRKRYQRPDEILWGLKAGNEEDDKEVEQARNAYAGKNPAVNDLHPPVVSTRPAHKSETKWMLQPPPSAKVMEGKERLNRSRSGSGGSHGSSKRGGDSVRLNKQVGERLMEEKVRRGETPPTLETAAASRIQPKGDQPTGTGITEPRNQNHVRDATWGPTPTNKKRAPQPIHVSGDDSGEDGDSDSPNSTDLRSVRPKPQSKSRTKQLRQLQRPPLNTTTSTSSLQILQELVFPTSNPHTNSSLNIMVHSPPAAVQEAKRIQLPPQSGQEEDELRIPVLETLWPVDGRGFGLGRGGLGLGDEGLGVEFGHGRATSI